MNNNIVIHDFPGKTIRLLCNAPDSVQSPGHLMDLAIKSVFSFADGWCEFLSAEVHLVYCDTDVQYPLSNPVPPKPFWLIKKQVLPKYVEVKPNWVNLMISITDRLTPDALMAWFDQAMNQSGQHTNDVILSWEELLFTTTCVRLPDHVFECTEEALSYLDNQIPPIRLAPFANPPVTITLSNGMNAQIGLNNSNIIGQFFPIPGAGAVNFTRDEMNAFKRILFP